MFEALGVDPSAVCVVGDSLEWDIRPARMLGCRTVLYDPDAPPGEEGDRCEADIVARTLESLVIHLPGPQRLQPETILAGEWRSRRSIVPYRRLPGCGRIGAMILWKG